MASLEKNICFSWGLEVQGLIGPKSNFKLSSCVCQGCANDDVTSN